MFRWSLVAVLIVTTLASLQREVEAKVKINIVEGTPNIESTGTKGSRGTGYRPATTGNHMGGNNNRACQPGQVLKVTYSAGAQGDGRLYANVYSGGVLQIEDGDTFEYEIMWKEPDCNCSIDLEAGTEFRLRDHGPLDALGFSPHAEYNFNMSGHVTGQWYKRSWDLTQWSGKYLDKFVFAAGIPASTTRDAFYKFIRIKSKDGSVRRSIFADGSEPPTTSTFMSGTVQGSCQSSLVFSGDVRLHSRRLAPSSLAPNSSECSALQEVDGCDKLNRNVTLNGDHDQEEGPTTDLRFGSQAWAVNSVAFGQRGIISGELSVSSLSDGTSVGPLDWGFTPALSSIKGEGTDAVAASRPSARSVAALLPHHGELSKRRAVSDGAMMVRSLEVYVKDSRASDIVYWHIFNHTWAEPASLPLPLWVPFTVPEESPLTHLLDGSTLEVKVTYFVPEKKKPKKEKKENEFEYEEEEEEQLPQLLSETAFSERISFVRSNT